MPCPVGVSAPGKVLFAGGYLVTEREFSGLVFALDSRIHVVSSLLPQNSNTKAAQPGVISVVSPQFKEARWDYLVTKGDNGSANIVVKQVELEGSTKNPFVETTIQYVLNYISYEANDSNKGPPQNHHDFFSLLLQPIKITILADNGYYSQPQITPLPRFNKLPVTISQAHKTGLGSSAALVTALTACLYITYSDSKASSLIASSETQAIIHNLAQAAHCTAQGKVGSGFDIAAATYGSCVYRRFSPSILDPIRSLFSPSKLAQVVKSIEWDFSTTKRRVPPGLRIVMGDVDCGSSTPGMVSKVLSWRARNPQISKEIWNTLGTYNDDLANLFQLVEQKSETEGDELSSALKTLRIHIGPFPPELEESNPAILLFSQIRNKIIDIREMISRMGQQADVPIEPPAQTRLLNYVTDYCPGVLGGVVPGAGGFDAVALLVADDVDVLTGLKSVLEEWNFENGGGGRVRVLETREEHEGLRFEDPKRYREWI